MKTKKYLLTAFLAVSIIVSSGTSAFSSWYRKGASRNPDLFISGNLGYNILQKGYTGYKNYLYLGSDLYIVPQRKSFGLGKTGWKDKMFYRVSLEYLPMVVPEGVYNTTEDIIALTGDLLFPVYTRKKYEFFFGAGVGVYNDWIRIDTPATGSVSGMSWFIGIKPSFGVIIKTKHSFDLVPEIRTHLLFSGNGYLATNTTIQLGLRWRVK